jgi:hypothetical protein
MIKKIIGIIGILIMIAGWVLSNAGRFDFVYKLFAADYLKAKTALNQMEETHDLLEEGAEGFNEISKIAGEFIKAKADSKITAIKTLGWDKGQGKQGKSRNIAIEVYFSTGPPVLSVIHNIDEMIEARYYKKDFFVWSKGFFWAGVLLVLWALFT